MDTRKDVIIVTEWDDSGRHRRARALISKPNFKNISVISNNISVIELKRQKALLNTPIYLGFVVLELSKYPMYDFHYDYMKTKYSDNQIKLAYMDTDSFVHSIKTENF